MAYAVVVSAFHEMESFMQSFESGNPILNSAMKSIHEEISSMLSFLDKFTPVICRRWGLDDVDQQMQDFV